VIKSPFRWNASTAIQHAAASREVSEDVYPSIENPLHVVAANEKSFHPGWVPEQKPATDIKAGWDMPFFSNNFRD
jgi:hypothetical protein